MKVKFIKSFLVLFFTIGFPVVPYIDIPIAFFLIFFNFNILNIFYERNKKFIFYFFVLVILYVLYSLILASGMVDFLFAIKILIKIVLGLIIGVIIVYSIIRSTNALLVWMFFQTTLILGSTFNENIYQFLLNFISASSRGTFENIYGLRSIGFGLYHVDGAILLASMSFLYVLAKMNKKLNMVILLPILVSTLVSRSSFIVILVLGIIKKPIGFLVILLLLLLFSNFISEEFGSIYQSLELFRNIVSHGEFRTLSTDANIDMIIFPNDLMVYLHGDGYFFSDSGFYKDTDLGWFRMLFYGGLPMVVLFLFLNLLIIVAIGEKNTLIKISLSLIFILMNFKGLYVISLIATIYLVYFDFINQNYDDRRSFK